MIERFYCEVELLVKFDNYGKIGYNSYRVSRNRQFFRIENFLKDYKNLRYCIMFRYDKNKGGRQEKIGYYDKKNGFQITSEYLASLS